MSDAASQKRYQYSKRAGALQENMAPPQQQQLTQSLSLSLPPPARSRASSASFRQAEEEEGGEREALTDLAEHLPVARKSRVLGGHGGNARDPHHNQGGHSMLFYTVEDGQQVLVVAQSGQMTVVAGPARVFRWGRRFRAMEHYVAHPGEFLVVRYRDGRQEHLPGPAHCWKDPRTHLSIEREEAVQLAAEEAVVVYAEATGGPVSRRVVQGPATFVLAPGEWLHTFSWHGSVNGQKVPNALVFQKLWLLPDQMYHDVAEVRTADDAVLTIRLMLFFRLIDIAQMLLTTHDPIGDFVNAATSDVVEFVRQHSFDGFKQRSDRLNVLETYPQLVRRAEQCGYRIDNVVYRGYGAPPALQQMHEKATESRTRLQLEKATEQQAQELEDLKLERAMARATRERQEERDSIEHKLSIQRTQREEDLRADADRRQAGRAQDQLDAAQQATLAREADARQQEHLGRLRELGVDLTALLTAGRPDRIVELRGDVPAHLHLRDD